MKCSIWATFLHYLYQLRIYFCKYDLQYTLSEYKAQYHYSQLNLLLKILQIPKAWMPHILNMDVSFFNYFIFCFNDDIDLSNKATFIFDTL